MNDRVASASLLAPLDPIRPSRNGAQALIDALVEATRSFMDGS
jgi:hypothetical protein